MTPNTCTSIISCEFSPSASSGISTLVPSYNHACFVERSLASILNQTLRPLELIVIDDGSTDDSPKIIERVLKTCSFPCELIVRPNRGLCATLNEGLERSRGRYFAYLASDDLWLPDFLRARVELLEARPQAVLAYGHAYTIDEQNRIIACSSDWAPYVDGDAQQMLWQNLAPYSPTVVYRRLALQRHRWNENARLEDYALYLRLSGTGHFAFDPRVLSAWRQHVHNTSRNLTLMINEVLAAQRCLAPDFGISPEMLRRFQGIALFQTAEQFMRNGHKVRGIQLAWQHLTQIPSLSVAVRMVATLLVPHRILRWRQHRMRRRAAERHGSVHSTTLLASRRLAGAHDDQRGH